MYARKKLTYYYKFPCIGWTAVETLDGMAGMSKQSDSPDCEYWRQTILRISNIVRRIQDIPVNTYEKYKSTYTWN